VHQHHGVTALVRQHHLVHIVEFKGAQHLHPEHVAVESRRPLQTVDADADGGEKIG